MIKLAYKLAILFFLIVIIGELGWKMTNFPFYWGNTQLNTKWEILQEKEWGYTTYFIGSSVTFRQVIPSVFDSLATVPTKSVNLGIDGNFAPQVFMILEELIKDTAIQYIVVELNSHDYFGPNFRTVDSKYYLQPKWLWKTISYLWNTELSIFHKVSVSGMYIYSYLEKLLGIDMREAVIKQLTAGNRFGGYSLMGPYKDGYYTLGDKTKEEKELRELPIAMKQLKAAYRTAYAKEVGNLKYNKIFKRQLLHYLELAKSKNIHLIYALNPVKCVLDSEEEMLGLFYQLPPAHRLDIADPNKYASFYEIANHWDIGHLNEQGAILYSKELAAAFDALID